jgi:hypothetical protein
MYLFLFIFLFYKARTNIIKTININKSIFVEGIIEKELDSNGRR